MTAVRVRVAGDERCPRCGATLCLTASITTAHPRTVALCPGCDAENPAARHLLDYFAAQPTVRPQDRAAVSELLSRWLGSITDGIRAPATLAEAAEAWWAARLGGSRAPVAPSADDH